LGRRQHVRDANQGNVVRVFIGVEHLQHDGVGNGAARRCGGKGAGAIGEVPLGISGTGRRFEDVDEIYIFHVRDGRLASAVAVEDNLSRMRQLGISVDLR
jgi:hypothetical protein